MAGRSRKPESLVDTIKNEIESSIVRGELRPGEKLDSEIVLAQEYGVSRPTLREAIKMLETEGLIERKNGIGNFVTVPKPFLSGQIDVDFSLSEAVTNAGLDFETITANVIKRAPTVSEQEHLKIDGKTLVYCIERIRIVNKTPIAISNDVLTEAIVGDSAVDEMKSIYSFLENECGFALKNGQAKLSAVIIDNKQSELLKVKAGKPALLVQQVDYDQNDHPVLFSREYYLSDHIIFGINRKRNVEAYAMEHLGER